MGSDPHYNQRRGSGDLQSSSVQTYLPRSPQNSSPTNVGHYMSPRATKPSTPTLSRQGVSQQLPVISTPNQRWFPSHELYFPASSLTYAGPISLWRDSQSSTDHSSHDRRLRLSPRFTGEHVRPNNTKRYERIRHNGHLSRPFAPYTLRSCPNLGTTAEAPSHICKSTKPD